MQVTTLNEIEEGLRQIDVDPLREMVYQMAHSHVAVCQLTSTVGDCSHISPDEIRDRVAGLAVDRLAEALAPTAWIAIDLHRRVGP